MSFDIKATHPRFDAFSDSWRLMRDAIDGEDDIKRRGTVYLPMKSGQLAMDDVAAQSESYNAYRDRAEFPEIVAPTITGQVGLMTSQPLTVNLPSQIEHIIDRATPDGMTLDDMFGFICGELLAVGRFGILPSIDGDGRGYLARYPAESIINWDTSGGSLNYAVLNETAMVRNPATNAWSERLQYRELSLADDGAFESRIWRGDIASGTLLPEQPQRVKVASTLGASLDMMPFVIIGTRGLAIDPDDVPLYGLAKIAVRMYRLDADYMQGLHMTSEPTPWISGFEDPLAARSNGYLPTAIGASTLWVLPPGGTCGFMEFSGRGIDEQRKAKMDAREAAATFGARMFDETSRAPESGESRKTRYTQETATLKTIAKSAASGIELALKNLARWKGGNPDDVSVVPNLDWVTDTMTPNELDAVVRAWQSGVISYETLFERMKAGKIVASDREIEDEIQAIADDPLAESEPRLDDPESGLVLRPGAPAQPTTNPAT